MSLSGSDDTSESDGKYEPGYEGEEASDEESGFEYRRKPDGTLEDFDYEGRDETEEEGEEGEEAGEEETVVERDEQVKKAGDKVEKVKESAEKDDGKNFLRVIQFYNSRNKE